MKARITGVGWASGSGAGRAGDGSTFCLSSRDLPEFDRNCAPVEFSPRFGRLDKFSRMGTAAAAMALKDAALLDWKEKRPIGIAVGSCYGCLTTDIDYLDTMIPEGGALASPNLFTYTLPSCFLGEAALNFGLTGPTFVITDTESPGLAAVRSAMEIVQAGEAEAMLAGASDLPCPILGMENSQTEIGAAFLVIKKANDGDYGVLDLDDKDELSFNGHGIKEFEELISKVIASGK